MAFDATFWVGVSFVLFFGVLIYLKVPQKINELLNKLISDIKNEIDESEKLRSETKNLLDNAQNKLDGANSENNKVLNQAKKDSEKLVIEMNDKFHKTAEIKKRSAETKIVQMKETALKDIKNISVKISMEAVEHLIKNSIDKSKLEKLYIKSLEQAKTSLKRLKA